MTESTRPGFHTGDAAGNVITTTEMTNSLPTMLAHYADVMADLQNVLPMPTQFLVSRNRKGELGASFYLYDDDVEFSATRTLLAWLEHVNVDAVTVEITSVGGADLVAEFELGGQKVYINASVPSRLFPGIREALGVPVDWPQRKTFPVSTATIRAALPAVAEGGDS